MEKRRRMAKTAELRTFEEIEEESQTVDFPDWRSPITSSLWPFATGKRTSTTRRPVTTDGVFRERTKIEGEELSTIASLESTEKGACGNNVDESLTWTGFEII